MSCASHRVIALCALTAALLMAGCAHQQTAPAARAGTPMETRSADASASVAAPQRHAEAGVPAQKALPLPAKTGIAACDDYLASYMACHEAAQIFTPAQLPARYQAMRTTLLRDSMNPDIRPELAERCNSLATQLRQALHGKSCEVNPAPAASSP